WKQLGNKGEWAATIAGAVIGDKLYTVESSGILYVTDTKTGKWNSIGKAEFAATVFMFACGNNLLTIEKDGSLYSIETK
ncbi:MAG TPA: hypothetical protein PK351_00900, partial [Spirochaetota bacterium]|nr:hypothetical protein [Spirochaetota bacterium]